MPARNPGSAGEQGAEPATEAFRTVPVAEQAPAVPADRPFTGPPVAFPPNAAPPSPAPPAGGAADERLGTDDATATADPDAPVIGVTGARFGGSSARRRRSEPVREPAAEPVAERPPAGPPPVPPLPGVEPDAAPDHLDPSSSSFVRPYVLTRGRTRSRFELSIETLVSAVPMAVGAPADDEHAAVVALCREPRSVAEVAALLAVPLGVARVLLGDLAATGVVAVHRTVGAAGPDLALMERVLTGLRKL